MRKRRRKPLWLRVIERESGDLTPPPELTPPVDDEPLLTVNELFSAHMRLTKATLGLSDATKKSFVAAFEGLDQVGDKVASIDERVNAIENLLGQFSEVVGSAVGFLKAMQAIQAGPEA